MTEPNNFPDINLETFTGKDRIYHSLIEARIFRNYSQEFILQIIEKLKEYKEKNGDNIIIDILFAKYLNHANTDDLVKAVQALSEKGEFNSQFHFALALFCSIEEFKYLRNKIYIQSWKLCTNDIFLIDEIQISNVIAFYVIRRFYNCFTKEMIIKNDDILKSKKYKLNENYKNYRDKYNETIAKYNESIKRIEKFYSIDFWNSYNSGNENDIFIINVENDPYLLNAAAQMCYYHPLIKVNYDVSKLQFPEYISLDMMKLIRYQFSYRKLLDFEPYSIEIKNLCSLVYLLALNQVSFKDLEKYKELMSPNSFIILVLVYMNYTKEEVPQSIFDYTISKLDYSDTKNIFLIRMINILRNNKEDLLYVTSKWMPFQSSELSNANYAHLKNAIYNQKYNIKNENNELIEKYINDFRRFMKKLIIISKGQKKLYLINVFQNYSDDSYIKIEYIMCLIDENKFSSAYDSMMKLNLTNEQINILKDENHFPKIYLLMRNIPINSALDIYEKLDLKDKIDLFQKLNIFLRFSLSTNNYKINRSTLLQDSVDLFKKNDMKNVRIRIKYDLEKGIDEGGLAKDWFTNVSDETIKSNVFITVPNGTSLTFNPYCDYKYMYKFAGEFIALAITNKKTIGLKLSSFIWKKILGKEVTLEDMKDYDIEIYQSLKWISENDPSDLMMTFVDSNDEELCENGKDIDLNEENKDYIEYEILKKIY